MNYFSYGYTDRTKAYRDRKQIPGADLTAEEIRQERMQSGWNPYADEEEPMQSEPKQSQMSERKQMMPEPLQPELPQSEPSQPPMPEWQSEPEPQPRPFFMQPEFSEIMEEQKQVERDLRTLQSMYPNAARTLLPYVAEECDKMEYEGSPMYAEYPDQTTIYRIQDRIYQQVKDQFDVTEEAPDEILALQFDHRRRDPRGKNWLDDLARVLLLQEMHHRRCRRRGCRR